jgi:hypothetical protein
MCIQNFCRKLNAKTQQTFLKSDTGVLHNVYSVTFLLRLVGDAAYCTLRYRNRLYFGILPKSTFHYRNQPISSLPKIQLIKLQLNN